MLFVTNNSSARIAEHVAALAAIGIDASDDVVSSAMAAALLVEPGERVLVTGGAGITEALEARGSQVTVNDGSAEHCESAFDAVVVGIDRRFDYARLRCAGRAVLAGARLIGTNRDTTYPTPHGLEPGGGSIVAAIAAVGGVDAAFAGKPESPMADLVCSVADATPDSMVMVGDRVDTDGLFAERLGCEFALVETGVTPDGQGAYRDLAELADTLG